MKGQSMFASRSLLESGGLGGAVLAIGNTIAANFPVTPAHATLIVSLLCAGVVCATDEKMRDKSVIAKSLTLLLGALALWTTTTGINFTGAQFAPSGIVARAEAATACPTPPPTPIPVFRQDYFK